MLRIIRSLFQNTTTSTKGSSEKLKRMYSDTNNNELMTLGGGCFWCTEAIYQRVKGVNSIVSGYAGGTLENPTYRDICNLKGAGGHAEVIQISFDPSIVTYEDILNVFFRVHDPTTLNRQGNDSGPQYRSIILYHNEKQQETAHKVKDDVEAQKIYRSPIVTEIVPLKKFWPAEDYHQDYYNDNPNQGYCAFVIRPKLDKFHQLFKDKNIIA